MAAYKALMFDLDDTLYDFSGNWELAIRKTFQEHRLTAALDQLSAVAAFNHYSSFHWSLVHRGAISFDEYRFKRLGSALADFGIALSEVEFSDFNTFFIENNLQLICPNEADIRQMAWWSERYRLGIITNGPADLAAEKIKRLGLDGFIPEEQIVVSERTGYFKPQAEIFRCGLNRLGVQSHEAVFIGDSWKDDVEGAMGAGVDAIWLAAKEELAETADNNPQNRRPLGIIRHFSEAEQYL
ncbi:MAG: family hydrolase [Paenibacillaceae bacterium]|jgi:putative hydrolase of the HAD superfamily|nr:family hydrolase [Paenibacillaceae bacterium]